MGTIYGFLLMTHSRVASFPIIGRRPRETLCSVKSRRYCVSTRKYFLNSSFDCIKGGLDIVVNPVDIDLASRLQLMLSPWAYC